MKCRFLASKTYEIHENLRSNVNNCSTVKVVGGISSCRGENYKTLKNVVMMLGMRAKVLLHVWSYNFMARRYLLNNSDVI